MSQQYQPYNPPSYQRHPVNHPTKGFEYEDKVRLFALLNLSDGQHLAVEMKDAPKFDDLVLFIEPSAQPNQHGFYFRQLKHNQNPSQNINWDDLFKNKKSKYYLPSHYEKFSEILKNHNFCDPNDAQTSWIRELSIMTNIGFESNTLNTYFYEVTAGNVWGDLAHNKPDAKRYKLNKQLAMRALQVNHPKMNKADADKFFELLVFQVNYPNVESMEQELKTKMKSFFPSYNDQELEETTATFKEKGLSLFNAVLCNINNTKNWIKSSDRNVVFVSITPRIISFGLRSVNGEIYEQSVLQSLHETIELSETYNQSAHTLLKQLPDDTVNVVNIFCDPKETLPTIASLKVYKYLLTLVNNGDGNSTSKCFEIMHIDNRDQLAKILNSIGKHCYEPLEKFCLVIEMASDIGGSEFLNVVTSSGIAEKWQSWKNMKLIVISDNKDLFKEIPIISNLNIKCQTISDKPLEWNELSHKTRVYLSENKILYLEGNRKDAFEAWRKQNNKETSMPSSEINTTVIDECNSWKTSLESLGLSNNMDEWIDSLSLAELILHNEKRPLNLGLPKYDSDLDTTYIDRKIKLPLFNTTKQNTKETNSEVMKVNTKGEQSKEMSEELTPSLVYIEKAFREEMRRKKDNLTRPFHLLTPYKNETIWSFDWSEYDLISTKGEKSKEMSEELKQRLVYIEAACREEIKRKVDNLTQPFHLLTPVDSNVKGSHLWLTSSNERTEDNYAELKDYMLRSEDSSYSIDEPDLLFNENVPPFGTLSASDDKLVIVVDLPGKGKTSLLTSLANQFLKRYQSDEEKFIDSLILRVNLVDAVQASAWQNKSIKKEKQTENNHQTDGAERTTSLKFFNDEDTATDFLVRSLLSFENDNKTANKNLSQKIIKQMCLNESWASVFVLLDGFDEISDEQRSVIYDLTDQLVMNAKGIKRIILTSRPDKGLESKLQEHYKQFVLHLKNFDENDQINFLVKRWDVKLREAGKKETTERDDVRKYAKALVQYSKKALKDEDRLFLDIPLQCMVVSEVFFEKLVEYVEKCPKDPASTYPEFHEKNFDLLELYNQFYETKIDVLLRDKANLRRMDIKDEIPYFLKRKLKQNFSNAVQRLAIFHMMKNIQDAELLGRIKWKTYRNSKYGDDLEQARRLGLTRAVDESQLIIETLETPHVKFIHRTFAEYFFANFLLAGFIETKSELLDNDFYTPEILNETFNIIFKEILNNTEYAGVMRFFLRMLANHVPLDLIDLEQPSPFGIYNRIDVFKKWPVVSHEKLNTFLTQKLLSEIRRVRRTKRGEKEEEEKEDFGLLNQLLIRNNQSIGILLMLCIKEYASRPGGPNDQREALARSVTSFLLDSIKLRIWQRREEDIVLCLQWCDPVVGLSDNENRVFSGSILKLVNELAKSILKYTYSSEMVSFGVLCSRMNKYHRHHLMSSLQDEFKSLVKSIFNRESRDSLANCYCRVNEVDENYLTDELFQAQKISEHFRDVLSLSTLFLPRDSSLLQLQVDWFLAQLAETANYLDTEIVHDALKEYSDITTVNPFTIIETIEFLLKQLDELKKIGNEYVMPLAPAETKRKIVESAWDYLIKVLPLFVRVLSPKLRMTMEREKGQEIEHEHSPFLEYKAEKIVSNLLWHLALLPEKIIFHHHQQHEINDDHQSTLGTILDIFYTPIGRSTLIAFACASCCQYEYMFDKYLIYFPVRMHKSEETRKEFDTWFKDKLEIVWQEKTEREFIDFLFNNEYSKLLPDVEWPEQDEFQLSALPCLLFSDIVSAYIPHKLSRNGLQHLEDTLKQVHLPDNNERSLWDRIIMQEDLPFPKESVYSAYDDTDSDEWIWRKKRERCKHNPEQVRLLKDAIENRKTELALISSTNKSPGQLQHSDRMKGEREESAATFPPLKNRAQQDNGNEKEKPM